ncbi:MAG: DUF1616 domain-containing protein [Candidatus Aenigmatarchaeota archaeon]
MFRIILTGLFVLFLPGFSLINAVFPLKGELNEELDLLYRVIYGIGTSVAIVILLGFVLGSLPYDGGYFTARYLWIGLIVITISSLMIGWYRGAYQWLGYLHPSLSRSPSSIKSGDEEYEREMEDVKELQRLKRKQMALKKEIKDLESGRKKKRYEKKLEEVEKELEILEKKVEKRF